MSDLETHLKTKHKQHQTYECDNCKKKFLTNWRLDKHARIHNGSRLKRCKYDRNNEPCPFEDLGCKFEHSETNHGKEDFSHILTDNFNDTSEFKKQMTSQEYYLFFTSTPSKTKLKCEDCKKECTKTCRGKEIFQAIFWPWDRLHRVPFLWYIMYLRLWSHLLLVLY